MMEYKVTRMAPDELRHWGIKGQKWGVRRFQNEDGTLTEEGKARYYSAESKRQLADMAKISLRRTKPTSFRLDKEDKRVASVNRQLQSHPIVREAAARVESDHKKYVDLWRATDQECLRFYTNEKLYEKYLNKAVDAYYKDEGKQLFDSRDKVYNWFKYDDGDQGARSTIELYKKSPEGKKYADLIKRTGAAYKNYSSAMKKYISEYLGAYGNEKISYGGGYNMTVTDRLCQVANSLLRW